jgi:hypothetical protein
MNRAASLLLILPFCTACYTYAPVEISNVTPGSMVRARIAADQMARVEPLVGRQIRVLDGVLVDASVDTLLIEVPAATRTITGGGIQVLAQRLSIPRTGVTEVELKRLSRGRTFGLIAIGTAAIGYIIIDALNIGPGKEGIPNDGGGEDFRIPLLRLRH